MQELKLTTAVLLDEGTVDPNDPANIAYRKPVRSNVSNSEAFRITDGDDTTYWAADFFPACADVDLLDIYRLNKLQIVLPKGKCFYYTVYASIDGIRYSRIWQKRTDQTTECGGDTIYLSEPVQCRILRISMEYTQGFTDLDENCKAYLSEVRAYGTLLERDNRKLRTGSLEEILGVSDYKDTEYALPITEEETIENVYGIIDRTIGKQYRSWFCFELSEEYADSSMNWFELSDTKDNKIRIRGDIGLSLACGLNHYYKYYLNVQISEQTMQVNMPDFTVPIGKTVFRQTPCRVRYAFNYCAEAYTFAFFDSTQWQREYDWLALNGVNVVLDLAGQEAVWIKFLMNFGYTFDAAKNFLTGPIYSSWQFMMNMERFGGPIADGYIKDRLESARRAQRWRSSLGISTVLQGYGGMVPSDFKEYQPEAEICEMGVWAALPRPPMISPDCPEYAQLAELFYKAQEFVYGTGEHYYAADPFHEAYTIPKGLDDRVIADHFLNSLLQYDSDAVWVVQAWLKNPTEKLLEGMQNRRREHVLVVDLIKYPIESNCNYERIKLGMQEFAQTSWAWCLLGNFGGNTSMHGQLAIMAEKILTARKECRCMEGLGVISEAQYDNPVVYDLIYELAWVDPDAFDLDNWLHGYLCRRYGKNSENAQAAWQILKNANYNYGVPCTTELFGLRLHVPKDVRKQNILYGADHLEYALRLLCRDFDILQNSPSYCYDLTELAVQQISNYSVLQYNRILDAKACNDLTRFRAATKDFLHCFDIMNRVLATQKNLLGGEWIGRAHDSGAKYDDFSADMFTLNAKALITTWASRKTHIRNLKDYGYRYYEGVFKDLNTRIWTDFLDDMQKELETGIKAHDFDKTECFDLYWHWILSTQHYTRVPNDCSQSVLKAVTQVLKDCTVEKLLAPEIGNLAAHAILYHAVGCEENPERMIGGDVRTSFDVSGSEIILDLIGVFQLSVIEIITKADPKCIAVSISEDGKEWNDVFAYLVQPEIKKYAAHDRNTRFIKVAAGAEINVHIAELRAYGGRDARMSEKWLNDMIQFAQEQLTLSSADTESKQLIDAIRTAKQLHTSPESVGAAYWELYDILCNRQKKCRKKEL